jgi:hypothetical protein
VTVVFVFLIFQVSSFFKFDGCVCQSWCNQFVVFCCHRSLEQCLEQDCYFRVQTLGIG